jgi:RNA polymerase sigma-70 factor (ECF subfamily)
MKEIDELTIRLAAKKDPAAFKRIYDYYAEFVWKVIFRTVNGDGEAAKEIVQDTFVRVLSSLKSFSFKSGLSTWIYRIAFNAANTYVARNKRMSFFAPEDMDALAGRESKNTYEDEELVRILLSGLSTEERFLITSREVEGIPFDELALVVGRSSESLRTQISRLKEKLRSVYEQRFSAREIA